MGVAYGKFDLMSKLSRVIQIDKELNNSKPQRRHAPLVTSFMIGRKDNRRNIWNKEQEPWNNRGACYLERMKLEVTKRCVASETTIRNIYYLNFLIWV